MGPPAPPMPPWFAPGLDCYSHKDCANDKIRSTCVVQDSHAWALCISCDKQLFQDDCPYWTDQNVSTPDKKIEDFVTPGGGVWPQVRLPDVTTQRQESSRLDEEVRSHPERRALRPRAQG